MAASVVATLLDGKDPQLFPGKGTALHIYILVLVPLLLCVSLSHLFPKVGACRAWVNHFKEPGPGMPGERSKFVRLIRSFSPRAGSDDAAKTAVLPSFYPTVIRGPPLRLGRRSTLRGLEVLTGLSASYVCRWNACDRDPCCSSQAEGDDSFIVASRRPV